MENYLKKQIPTYMGNKRKLLGNIETLIDIIGKTLNHKPIIAEGFSGSGVVSRLFKKKASLLYTNDIAGYSATLNQCFLSTPSKKKRDNIRKHITLANQYVNTFGVDYDPWISLHWAAFDETNVTTTDRVYYTRENAVRIDKYRYFIDHFVKEEYKCYLLAMLLVEASIHTNTNGQFSAFYKKDGKGEFGGKTGTDIKRITAKITLTMPILNDNPAKVSVSCEDTNDWVKKIPKVDIMYYDPPYNKHPYSIYYFLLDIINNWDRAQAIPDTYRGQPKTWKKSDYNSFIKAKKTFEELIMDTKARYIILSYNNGGIIPIDEVTEILTRKGHVSKIPVVHKTYNKLKGIANYKRKKESVAVKEYLWLVECYSR